MWRQLQIESRYHQITAPPQLCSSLLTSCGYCRILAMKYSLSMCTNYCSYTCSKNYCRMLSEQGLMPLKVTYSGLSTLIDLGWCRVRLSKIQDKGQGQGRGRLWLGGVLAWAGLRDRRVQHGERWAFRMGLLVRSRVILVGLTSFSRHSGDVTFLWFSIFSSGSLFALTCSHATPLSTLFSTPLSTLLSTLFSGRSPCIPLSPCTAFCFLPLGVTCPRSPTRMPTLSNSLSMASMMTSQAEYGSWNWAMNYEISQCTLVLWVIVRVGLLWCRPMLMLTVARMGLSIAVRLDCYKIIILWL